MANSERRRPTRCCIFSTKCQVNFWLTFLLAVYLCLGALVFLLIEAPYRDGDEDPPETNVTTTTSSKEQLLNALWSLKSADRDEWTRSANAAISEYEVTIILDDYRATSSERPWNFATCMYMVVMAITTIGYGDVAPITQTGRFLMIFYNVLGVPLNLLFLSNFGILLAKFTSRRFAKLGKNVKYLSGRIKVCCARTQAGVSDGETRVHAPQGHNNANCTVTDETTRGGTTTDGDHTGDGELSNETIRESSRGNTTMNGSANATGSVQMVGSESDVYELSEVQDAKSEVARQTTSETNGNYKHRATDVDKADESMSDNEVSRPGDLVNVQPESNGCACSGGNLCHCQNHNSEPNNADISEMTQNDNDVEARTAEDVDDIDAPIIDSDPEAKGKALGTLSVIYLVYTVLGGLFLYFTENGWTYIDAIYCTFISLATIGFGDLIPGAGKQRDVAGLSLISYLLFTYIGLIIFSACFALSVEKIIYVARKIRRKIDICGCCGHDVPG